MRLSSNVLLIRHSHDNHSYIDGENNTSLTPQGEHLALEISQNIANLIDDKAYKRVVVYSSDRKRATETAAILCEVLSSHKIQNGLHIDERLRELYQGKILNIEKLSHIEKAKGLELEWERFDSERLGGNYFYKFGQQSSANSDDKFIASPYGESHDELSRRTKTALYNILQSAVDDSTLVIVITHRGIIREIFNVIGSINNHKPIVQNMDNEMKGWGYCVPEELIIKDINSAVKDLRSLI
jgi:broad specificity phosphatase PhoE